MAACPTFPVFHRAMEDIVAFRAETTYTIPANLSSSSLEIGQILGTDSDIAHSLLSESVTCASFSSDYSDSLHAFPPRALPTFTTVALGEHLKMFPTLLPGSGRKYGHCAVLAAPTVPRLRSMCKECLSITKWAEYSTTCEAPEHIPWEGILKSGTKEWVPEGSIFSPEGFSYILSQARKGRIPHDETDSQQNCVATISAPGTFDSEVLGIMRELQSLRSYFAGTLQGDPNTDVDSLDRPSVPALVVSTSHVTFPLTLESCQTLSQQLPSTIASRRGKEAPPPLTIRPDNALNWIEYPGIPSAFLGSPSSQSYKHYDEAEDVDLEKTLCVEEMINNLRLQCSAMSLQSPSIDDPSWNSRSAIPTLADKKRSDGTLCSLGVVDIAKGPLNPKKVTTQMPRPTIGRRNSGLPPPRYERQPNPPRTMRTSRCVGNLPARINKPTPAAQTLEQVALRSAMKESGIHRKNVLKNVRFALPQSDVQEDLARPNPGSGSQGIPRINEVKTARRNMISKSSLHLTLPMISVPKINSSNTTASPSTVITGTPNTKAQVGPRHSTKGRAQSITISSPFRKIALSRGSVELKTSSSESGTPAVGLRRAHTLGRHSLSRVIKFCPSKRTTISVDSAAFRRSGDDDKLGREVKKRRITDFGGLFNRFKQ